MPRNATALRVTSADYADDLSLDDVQLLEKFCSRYPDIANQPRLRWWIFNRRTNGLEASGALVKKAGRWYVVVPRMKDWLLQAA